MTEFFNDLEQQDGHALHPDHPNSDLWPEVFSNGREQFSEGFYKAFPWARGIDPFDEDAETTVPGKCWVDPCDSPISVDPNVEAPPVLAFVRDLINLELDDLPEDEQSCPVCINKYREGEYGEMPLELPCGHVVGRDCLITWLSCISGVNDEISHNSCPTCRTELISEQRMSIDTEEGLAQLLRDVNYHLCGDYQRLNPKWSLRWEHVKRYVNDYLDEEKHQRPSEGLRERRHHIFMEILRKEVQKFWSVRTMYTVAQLARAKDEILFALDMLDARGIIDGYLARYCNANAEREWNLEVVEAQLNAAAHDLGERIKGAYERHLAGTGPDVGFEAAFARKLVIETKDLPALDPELGNIRFHSFLTVVEDEIIKGPSLLLWTHRPCGQEGILRDAVGTLFANMHHQKLVKAWFERADIHGLEPENSCNAHSDEVSRLLQRSFDNVHRTHFARAE